MHRLVLFLFIHNLDIVEEVKRGLESQLLRRPSVGELVSRRILKFGDAVEVIVEGKGEYERRWA